MSQMLVMIVQTDFPQSQRFVLFFLTLQRGEKKEKAYSKDLHVETGANDIRGDEVAAETENDDGDDELQDANGDPTLGIVGHVLLARSSHSGTHLVSIF